MQTPEEYWLPFDPDDIPYPKHHFDAVIDTAVASVLPSLKSLNANDPTWKMSEDIEKMLRETIQKVMEINSEVTPALLMRTCEDFTDKLTDEGIISFPCHMEYGTNKREFRRSIRWDERNRRRVLKGLHKINNPYPRAISYTFLIQRYSQGPFAMEFRTEDQND